MYIPLAWRLTGFYAIILTVALSFFGILIDVQVTQRAYHDLDVTLSNRADSVQMGKLMLTQPDTLPEILPGIAGVGSEGVAIEVLDQQLKLLATTDSNVNDPLHFSLAGSKSSPTPWDAAAARTLLQRAPTDAGSTQGIYSTIMYEGQRIRVYTRMNNSFGALHIIETASSESGIEQSLHTLHWFLLGGGALIIVCAAASGWFMAHKLLTRVQHITQIAQSISQERKFDQRVELPSYKGKDELSQLTTTFNTMLDQLAKLYHYQQRFIADASHELRAPITSICCNLDLLTQAPDLPPDEVREALADTKDEADRMGRLVNDLLTLAHSDARAHMHQQAKVRELPALVDLDSLVLEVFRQYRPGGDGKERPRLLLQHIIPACVAGNADQLKQALVVLVDNALKYTPAQGTVTLTLVIEGAWSIIRVSDTGRGIAPEDLPHIFERFFQATQTRSQSGSGLGLAIARSIVEEHGGTLQAESIPEAGSTFTLRLPLAVPPDQ